MPGMIYEILPYLYMCLGAAAALGMDVIYGRLFGVLLLVVGGLILKMRIRHRGGIFG